MRSGPGVCVPPLSGTSDGILRILAEAGCGESRWRSMTFAGLMQRVTTRTADCQADVVSKGDGERHGGHRAAVLRAAGVGPGRIHVRADRAAARRALGRGLAARAAAAGA